MKKLFQAFIKSPSNQTQKIITIQIAFKFKPLNSSNQLMSKNQSLLSMLPPQAQKQILLLIKRLGDEKQAKQQAQRQCLQYEAEISQLKKQLEKLKKQNIGLKAKWQNKVEMISKVRENFGSGSKREEGSGSKKKLRFNKEEGRWNQDESEEEDELMQDQMRINNRQNQMIRKQQQQTHPNNHINTKHSLHPNNHFSIQSPPIPTTTTIQTTRSTQQQPHHQTHLLPYNNSTVKKPPRPTQPHSLSKSKLNLITRSNKKLQIECLKQQIQQLTEQIRNKETGGMSLDDKIRRCEEIKNRYRKGKGGEEKEVNGSMLMGGCYSPRKQSHNVSSINNHQQSFINELSSNYKPQQHHLIYTQEKPHHSPINNTNSSFINTFNTNNSNNQSHLLKQNIHINSTYTNRQPFPHHNSLMNQSGIMGNSIQIAKHNMKQMSNNNSNSLKKTSVKPVQQSFYDDGLLDLIAEMNP